MDEDICRHSTRHSDQNRRYKSPIKTTAGDHTPPTRTLPLTAMDSHPQQHFLIVTFPVQGHVNPALHLAHRLIFSTGALVTFSTSASATRRMFPSPPEGGNLTLAPYPDGYETRAFQPESTNAEYVSDPESYAAFSSILLDLAARGRRVTCLIHTLLLTWAADLARRLGIPTAQFWIQPATTFASYYHYFHGHEALISAHRNDPLFPVKLPGLPLMQIRDLPSFIVSATSDGPYSMILPRFKVSFEKLDEEEPKAQILLNTFDELEPEALASVDKFDFFPVGLVLPTDSVFHLFKQDEKLYMEWLDKKPERSVVYVSFGSISVIEKLQMEEILKGLKASGRPYLWAVRKDSRWEGVELDDDDDEENAMVVEWCSQVRVLNHPSIGCFVTHCGWNSMTESMSCGVPTVGMPQWADQGTNAMLAEKAWGMGVRGEVNDDGILEGDELKRCLDLVMGEGERGGEIRRQAELWRERAKEAVGEGGSSDRNLRAFVQEIAKRDQSGH